MTSPLTPDNIALDVPARDRDAVLASIAETANALGYCTDPADVVKAMIVREGQSSTALLDGIAIPHAKTASIVATGLIVVRLDSPVDWDGAPVRLALGMLVPEAEAGTTHLKLLAKVARALMDQNLRTGMLAAASPQAVFELLQPRVTL